MTKLFCPPTVWIALLRHPAFDTTRPVVVAQGLLRRLGDARRGPARAQPSACPTSRSGTSTARPRWRRWPRSCARTSSSRRIGSAGRASLNVETRIVDDDDAPVPPGTVGEIVHRSPQATIGYWNDPERTAEAFRGGWFHSGDLGVMDADGYLSRRRPQEGHDQDAAARTSPAARSRRRSSSTRPSPRSPSSASPTPTGSRPSPPSSCSSRGARRSPPTELIEHARGTLAGYKAPKYVTIGRGPAQEPQRQDPQARAARGLRPAGGAVRLGNVAGRAALVLGDEIADVETASSGRFGPDPRTVYDDWTEFREFAATVTAGTGPLLETELGCAVPMPRQVFAIGLNYRQHAAETGATVPDVPATFTKFPASLAGPFDDIPIHGTSVDWEVELVVVIGARADQVTVDDGWSHVAGVTVGQDISDRQLQVAAGRQFSLGKSRRGYGPMGPWVVTTDELADPDDLALGCSVERASSCSPTWSARAPASRRPPVGAAASATPRWRRGPARRPVSRCSVRRVRSATSRWNSRRSPTSAWSDSRPRASPRWFRRSRRPSRRSPTIPSPRWRPIWVWCPRGSTPSPSPTSLASSPARRKAAVLASISSGTSSGARSWYMSSTARPWSPAATRSPTSRRWKPSWPPIPRRCKAIRRWSIWPSGPERWC